MLRVPPHALHVFHESNWLSTRRGGVSRLSKTPPRMGGIYSVWQYVTEVIDHRDRCDFNLSWRVPRCWGLAVQQASRRGPGSPQRSMGPPPPRDHQRVNLITSGYNVLQSIQMTAAGAPPGESL